jgi:hypothetical protein
VNYPEEALGYTLIVASFAPAAIICLTLVSFSRHRKTVLTVSLIGAAIGSWWGLLPFRGGAMTVWQVIGPLFMPMAISSALGAVVFGGVALALDPPVSRFPPDEPPPRPCS